MGPLFSQHTGDPELMMDVNQGDTEAEIDRVVSECVVVKSIL